MSEHYGRIAFTAHVEEAQSRYGRRARPRLAQSGNSSRFRDPLTEFEAQFLTTCEEFYVSTVSDTGWPYVQFRGGPPGFLRLVNEHTVGWADFRGNRQYITTGNLLGNDRVAMILMDHARQRRLKIFGRARVVDVASDSDVVLGLADTTSRAIVERAMLIDVEAFDWNCAQHIPAHCTPDEIDLVMARPRGSGCATAGHGLSTAAPL